MPPQVWQLSNRFREVTPMSPGASSDRLVRLNGDLSQCKGLDGAAHTPPKPGSSLKGGVSNLELVF